MDFEKLAEKAFSSHPNFGKYEAYYEKDHRLEALGMNIPQDARILEMVSAFPKLAVDVLVEVLNVEGFTLKDNAEIPAKLREWWQHNNLDTEIPLGLTEALVQGQAFVIVGDGTADIPRITIRDAKNTYIRRDYLGQVVEAVIIYGDEDDLRAEHYTPSFRQSWRKLLGKWYKDGPVRPTGTKRIPVVPLTNMSRLKDRVRGRSEMVEVMDLADAESRSLTNLQVAQELIALPQRYLFADGLKQFKDQNGDTISKFQAYISSLWTGPSGATAGQFPGADLTQIINVIKLYAQKVSSITGIPPSMLGISTDNPASAEAMRAAKERLITKGEFKQHLFGDDIEEFSSIALEMYGTDPATLTTLETDWRDVATPSKSAKSANILQAHSQHVVSAHTAREHIELTPEQRAYEDKHEHELEALAKSVGLGQPARPAPGDPQQKAEEKRNEKKAEGDQ